MQYQFRCPEMRLTRDFAVYVSKFDLNFGLTSWIQKKRQILTFCLKAAFLHPFDQVSKLRRCTHECFVEFDPSSGKFHGFDSLTSDLAAPISSVCFGWRYSHQAQIRDRLLDFLRLPLLHLAQRCSRYSCSFAYELSNY